MALLTWLVVLAILPWTVRPGRAHLYTSVIVGLCMAWPAACVIIALFRIHPPAAQMMSLQCDTQRPSGPVSLTMALAAQTKLEAGLRTTPCMAVYAGYLYVALYVWTRVPRQQ